MADDIFFQHVDFTPEEIERVVQPGSEEHAVFDNGQVAAVVFKLTDGCYFTIFPESDVYWRAVLVAAEME